MGKIKELGGRIRYNIVTTIIYMVGIILLIQLFNLQIIHGAEYRETSNSRLTRETIVKAARGSIKDRSGVDLVTTDTGYSVEIYNTKVDEAGLNAAIEKFINSIYFVLIIGILILAKTFLFYYNTIAVNEQLYSDTIIGTISFIVVIICFLFVLPNRARVTTSIIINFIISLVLFGDNIYYNYSNSVLSIAQITNLQYGGEIISTLPMVLKLYQTLYFLDIIALVILIVTKKIKIYKKGRKTKKQLIGKWIVGIIGVVIFCIIGVGYVEKGKEKSYNKDQQIREATIFGYHIYDIENIIKQTMEEKKIDYLILSEDEYIEDNIYSINNICNKYSIPMINTDIEKAIDTDILFSLDCNYYYLGRKLALLLKEVIKNKGKTDNIDLIEIKDSSKILINKDTAKHYNIAFTEEILKESNIIVENGSLMNK